MGNQTQDTIQTEYYLLSANRLTPFMRPSVGRERPKCCPGAPATLGR